MTLMPHPAASSDHCTGCPWKSRALCRAVRAGSTNGQRGPRVRRLAQDWVLQEEGEAPKLTGILRRGYLRTERMLEDGRRCIVGLSVPSDPVGAWLEPSGTCAVVAATDVEICTFEPQLLRSLMARDPVLRMQVLRMAADQHARQLELVWRRGALNSRERIIAFLVMAADIMPSEPLPDGDVIVSIPISRRDWADITNTTVETICRTLGQLVDQDLLQSLSPARYRIKDMTALSELAGIDPDLDRMDHGQTIHQTGMATQSHAMRTRVGNAGLPPMARKPLSGAYPMGAGPH
jgi:CRP/FNR family transcriptional regulator, anaerobic regulatory protein